jgi:hypothetical protein
MHALVTAQVDTLDGEAAERERRALDGIRRSKVREDRAMVIDVGVDVEEADARGFDGVTERADQPAVTPFADVRNDLNEMGGLARAPQAPRVADAGEAVAVAECH